MYELNWKITYLLSAILFTSLPVKVIDLVTWLCLHNTSHPVRSFTPAAMFVYITDYTYTHTTNVQLLSNRVDNAATIIYWRPNMLVDPWYGYKNCFTRSIRTIINSHGTFVLFNCMLQIIFAWQWRGWTHIVLHTPSCNTDAAKLRRFSAPLKHNRIRECLPGLINTASNITPAF
jgi:hypothetical protein